MSRAEREERRQKVSGRKRAEERRVGSRTAVMVPEGVELFKVEEDKTYQFDIIPYTVPDGAGNPYADDGQLHFERTYFVHYDIGPDEQSYVCPAKTAKKPCPICEERARLSKDPDARKEDIAALAPKERQLWNIFDHRDEDKGVQLWDFSVHCFGKQLDARVKNSDEEEGYEYFADPDDGSTIKVHFAKEPRPGGTFAKADSIDFKRRREPLSDELLDKAQVLDNLLIIEPYEKLKKIFLQEPATPDDEAGDEEKPRRERRSERASDEEKPSRSSSKPEKEPEPADEPPPKRSSKPEKGAYSRGDKVKHPEHGVCEVFKQTDDGNYIIVDKDDEPHRGIPADELKPYVEKASDKPSGNGNGKAEKQPEKAPAGKGGGKDKPPADDDDWDKNWDDD